MDTFSVRTCLFFVFLMKVVPVRAPSTYRGYFLHIFSYVCDSTYEYDSTSFFILDCCADIPAASSRVMLALLVESIIAPQQKTPILLLQSYHIVSRIKSNQGSPCPLRSALLYSARRYLFFCYFL